jgi:hypothetical protein
METNTKRRAEVALGTTRILQIKEKKFKPYPVAPNETQIPETLTSQSQITQTQKKKTTQIREKKYAKKRVQGKI